MRLDSKSWAPSRWTASRLTRFMSDMRQYAILAVCDIMGPYDGALVGAAVLTQLKEIQSAALLAAAGVKTLGAGGE